MELLLVGQNTTRPISNQTGSNRTNQHPSRGNRQSCNWPRTTVPPGGGAFLCSSGHLPLDSDRIIWHPKNSVKSYYESRVIVSLYWDEAANNALA